MKTITLTGISDELHRKLVERATAKEHSLEEEAVWCLQQSIEEDDALLSVIPVKRWQQIEQSLAAALHEPSADLTPEDFQRYRDLACGKNAS